jgi:hypothetical protein
VTGGRVTRTQRTGRSDGLQVMLGNQFRRTFQRFANVAEDTPPAGRILVHLSHLDFSVRPLALPPLVRAARHPMNELRGLHLLVLRAMVRLRVVLQAHLDSQPRRYRPDGVNIRLPQPRPRYPRPFSRFEATQAKRLLGLPGPQERLNGFHGGPDVWIGGVLAQPALCGAAVRLQLRRCV